MCQHYLGYLKVVEETFLRDVSVAMLIVSEGRRKGHMI